MTSLLPPQVLVFLWLVLGWMVVEGIALGRGTGWAFGLGIPLRWRERTVPRFLEREPVDLSDRLDREHSFETEYECSAIYLSESTLGLLYTGIKFGSRGFRIRLLRAIGVTVTATMQVDRRAGSTVFRWRPVVRLPPLLLLGSMFWSARFVLAEIPFGWLFVVWPALYLGAALWTGIKLPKIFHSVVDQHVERAERKGRSR